MWSTTWHGAARRVRALGALVSCTLCASGVFVGCSGSDSGDGSSSGGSGGTSAVDLGLPQGARIVASINQPMGECTSAAACAGSAGPACATVAGGYRVCTFQPPAATTASALPSLDQCGPGRACTSGNCYSVLNFPSGQCGNSAALTYNACRADTCGSDADCKDGGVCGPRGFSTEEKVQGGGIRLCLPAACKAAADCTKQPNGICALVQAGCAPAANGAQTFLPPQLACVYPRGCTSLSDCPIGDPPREPASYCRVVRGEGVCVTQ